MNKFYPSNRSDRFSLRGMKIDFRVAQEGISLNFIEDGKEKDALWYIKGL